ncbi:MAG: hypothetical protein HY810_01570 [Candidatus Omnitrophica bacterium]|nr:hypothetical protein [Candidatus Omnitrophota bacterium]
MLVQKLTSFEAKIDMVLSRIPAQPIAVPNVPKQQQQPVIASLPKPVRENRHMHKAICADCGMDCEVPFKPREDRQVYCKECFTKRKSNKSIFKPQVLDKPKQEIPVTINAAPAEKPKAAKPAESPKKPFKKKKKTNR